MSRPIRVTATVSEDSTAFNFRVEGDEALTLNEIVAAFQKWIDQLPESKESNEPSGSQTKP